MALRLKCSCFNREDVVGPISLNHLLYCRLCSVLQGEIIADLRRFSASFPRIGGIPIQPFMLQLKGCI